MSAFGARDRSPFAWRQRTAADVSELPLTVVTVVSTEEEFDWNAPFQSENVSTEAMASIGVGQSLFERCGVRPVYVIDYPIAAQERAWRQLREWAHAERCEIGTHLHPWVSPPLEERLGSHASFPGNLDAPLEHAKLQRLTETIESNLGVRPRCYQAGRYGFGPNTADALRALGYRVDFSAAPPFDYSRDGGPDYSRTPTQPAWLGEGRSLLSAPVSGAFVGRAGEGAARLYSLAGSRIGAALKLPGLLARTGMVERIRLSAEGHSFPELLRLTQALIERGDRVFVFSLHSPSFQVGGTPYAADAEAHRRLLSTCEEFYEHMFGDLGAVSMTGSELFESLRARSRTVATP